MKCKQLWPSVIWKDGPDFALVLRLQEVDLAVIQTTPVCGQGQCWRFLHSVLPLEPKREANKMQDQ